MPDVCEAEVDIRTIPGQDLSALLNSLTARFPGLEIERKKVSSPSEDGPRSSLDRVIGILRRALRRCSLVLRCGGICRGGMPAVALGPGSIGQAHTADEWIAVEDLEAGVAFFKRFLHSL